MTMECGPYHLLEKLKKLNLLKFFILCLAATIVVGLFVAILCGSPI